MAGTIYYKQLQTPIGPMIACAGNEGICVLEFYEEGDFERKLSSVEKWLKAVLVPKTTPYLEQAAKELEQYFAGDRKVFEVALQLQGTDFQKQAWQALQTIPYGATRSYMQQTLSFTVPESIRAVANANGKNPIAIIVPCHRVIGANGSLTGYAGGLWRKKYLLELEAQVKQGRLL
ncbi:MAG: methylated-DNA--[protein]-cysteine S-methyltransferase [Niabella sp.]